MIRPLALALSIGLAASDVAAQSPVRAARVGFVGPYSAGLDPVILRGFQERLAELGWREETLTIEYLWADGKFGRFPELAIDLAERGVDVLVIPCGPAIPAVRGRYPALPIVARCLDRKDLHGETGVTYFSPGATERRLDLLKTALPGLTHLGLLHRRGSDWTPHIPAVEAAARARGLSVVRAEWIDDRGLGPTIDDAVSRGARAFLTLGDGATHLHRHALFALAAERKVPVLYDVPMFPTADEPGLMAYYADVASLFRRAADHVDAILRGTRPDALPVSEPSTFRFMLNLRAARGLGLGLPDSLVRQADSVLK